jgi:hypothetical protein
VSREKNDIDKYRRLDSRLPIPAPKKPVKLEYPGVSGVDPLFVVKNSALEGRDASDTRTLDNTELPLRSDDLSAAHAFLRARDLFQRLENYGFDPKIYFRMAKLPLIVRHRAGIHPGAWDGETINAQVRPIGNGLSLTVPYAANDRSALEVRFAAADLSHRRNATDAKRTRPRAQHLGLAADSRWAWHEFGHVLIFAATGELELRFAHSFGDALAAIIHDPESNLAEPRTGVSRDRWRGPHSPGRPSTGAMIAIPHWDGGSTAGASRTPLETPSHPASDTGPISESRCSRARCSGYTIRSAAGLRTWRFAAARRTTSYI